MNYYNDLTAAYPFLKKEGRNQKHDYIAGKRKRHFTLW